MKHRVLGLALLTACGASTSSPAPDDKPAVQPVPSPVTAPGGDKIAVELAAVTLADDCGGTPPWGPPAQTPVKADTMQEPKADSARHSKSKSAEARRCEQTAMQLSVAAAPGGAPAVLKVKKVELFDDAGTSLGELTASSPTWWTTRGAYEPWDQQVTPGQLSVSYGEPAGLDEDGDRWNRTFTLKVTVGIGSADQTVHRDVEMVSAPTSLPPNVKT